ncbi:MAG: DUF3035 domain-containing protein [Pseudomonadota bacterium]
MRHALRNSLLVGIVLIAACGRSDPELMNISVNNTSAGPDEFSIVPRNPLVIPEDLAALPRPTPAGRNRADANPQADVVAALGGNAGLVEPDGTLRSEPALVAHVTRFGLNPDIRGELAAEDLAFRRANRGRLLERWFNLNVYYDAYSVQSLNQHAELRRLQQAGVQTPAPPPQLP